MKLEIGDGWDLIRGTRVDEVAIGVGLFFILFIGLLESTF